VVHAVKLLWSEGVHAARGGSFYRRFLVLVTLYLALRPVFPVTWPRRSRAWMRPLPWARRSWIGSSFHHRGHRDHRDRMGRRNLGFPPLPLSGPPLW